MDGTFCLVANLVKAIIKLFNRSIHENFENCFTFGFSKNYQLLFRKWPQRKDQTLLEENI